MYKNIITKIFTNGFLLLIPIFLFNIVFIAKLPEPFNTAKFDQGIPKSILYSENFLRIIVFSLPLVMNLKISINNNILGLIIYIIGVFLYFASWLSIIYNSTGQWSKGVLGFMAPAYTPIIWLLGIGLIGTDIAIFNFYKPWMYILLSLLFVITHSYHTFLAYINFYKN